MVGLLLSRSTSLLKIADSKGQTCLHVASANGHYEMVQALLGQGSDQTMVDKVRANFSSKKEKTHFMFLCKFQYKSTLHLLKPILGGLDTITLCSSGRIPQRGQAFS